MGDILKRLLLVFMAIICASRVQAQNIEGQIIASQFGQYQVPGIATGSLAFEPASCQVTGGGKNFVAFATGVPVKIVDANPALTEVDTPSSVNIAGCSISMATTYIHTTPFYATSGTGGLQEALTNGPNKQGGTNTVILTADWYTQVAPSNPATVIAAVKGSTKLGLVDVTTTPYTVYAWNGSAYAVVPYGGGGANFPSNPGVVFNTSTSASRNATSGDIVTVLGNAAIGGTATNLSGTPTLPNGTTATTGTVGENDNKLGTNAAIYASKLDSIPVTSLVLKGSGTAGKSAAAAAADIAAVLSPASGCTTAGFVYSPQSNTCISPGSGGAPGGSNNQLQINRSGVFDADPTLNFDFPSHTLLMLNENLAANGFATALANQPSGTFVMEADVWNGSAPVGVFYGQQVIPSTGSNPLTLMNFNCSSTSTGPCGANFNYPVFDSNNFPTGDKTTALATNLNVYNNQPAIAAQYFGAYGDTFKPPNGLSTTASSTTVGCPDGCFVAGDVGKDFWLAGAGPSGAAFHSTITAVSSNTTATVAVAATSTVTNGAGVYGHDDVAAVQACIKYSSVNAVNCVLKPAPAPAGQIGIVGYLIGSGTLHLTSNNFLNENSGPNIIGNSQSNGTNLFCEFNGFCLDLASGPIQGATLKDLAFEEDPTQPNSAGLHFNPQPGTFTNGPFTNSNLIHINVDNPSKECVWFDGGGGPGYAFNLPNQYITMDQFWCSGPNQSHPANLILMTGQAAQILFLNGQVNGCCWNGSTVPNYPNPMIKITEKTSTLGDTPVDVKFYGYTAEVGTQGLYIGNGANNIHFDNSYIENVATPFIVTGAVANTFNGNHIANSGNVTAVYQFAANSGAAVRDSLVYGGVAPAAWAVCSGSNQVDFANNNSGSGVTTNSCLYSVAVSSGTQAANSCSSPASQTITGLTTQSVITPGYSANPTGLVGWGSTGGMAFKIWPSANNTAQWSVCNSTASSISFGAITFNEVWK